MSVDGLSPAALAERFVLGAIMRDPAVLRDAQVEVTPRDFEDMRLGAIYAGMCRMAAEREPIDYLSVYDHLTRWDVRGVDLEQLAGWVQDLPVGASVGFYGRLVRERALTRALERVGSSLVNPDQPGIALSNAITELTALRDRDEAGATPSQTLRDVLAVPEVEDVYDWVIPDVLERGDRLMLTGGEGSGKSTLLRQMSILPAAGLHPFTFGPVDPIRVLVVDAENSERQWRRAVRKMTEAAEMQGRRDPRDHVALEFMSKSDITNAAVLGHLHRRMDETNPDLLLIGPLYRLAPGAIKDDDDATPVLNALDSLRERGVSLLIEAHAGHETSRQGVRNLRPRGSSALLGWPEFGLGLSRDKEVVSGVTRYSLTRWRGDRDHRKLPAKFVVGQTWPWEPAVGY